MTKLILTDLQTTETYELKTQECEAIVGGGILDTIGGVADVGSKVIGFAGSLGGLFGGGSEEKRPVRAGDHFDPDGFVSGIVYRNLERDGRLDEIIYV